MSDCPPLFTDTEIRVLAGKIEDAAKRNRVVRLLPQTALACAHALRVSRPSRDRIVALICRVPRCENRGACVPCIGLANAILKLLNDA